MKAIHLGREGRITRQVLGLKRVGSEIVQLPLARLRVFDVDLVLQLQPQRPERRSAGLVPDHKYPKSLAAANRLIEDGLTPYAVF